MIAALFVYLCSSVIDKVKKAHQAILLELENVEIKPQCSKYFSNL